MTFDSAAAYYAVAVGNLGESGHRAVRQRGADIAAQGPQAVARSTAGRLGELQVALPATAPDRKVAVLGDAVLTLRDYLETRVVEQVAHLDDLERSVGVGWQPPQDAYRLALEVGVDIGRVRFGGAAMVRALYRGQQGVLPVL